jgi:hypothetical protein
MFGSMQKCLLFGFGVEVGCELSENLNRVFHFKRQRIGLRESWFEFTVEA